MKQVFLVPNFTKEGTLAVADQVVPQLLSLGFSLLCEEETARRLGPQAQHCQVMPYGECLDRCDLILVLGGDGSILRIAADAARHSCPVLGIKTGNIGFMSELDAHELHYLEDLAQGRYTIDRRLMLDVSIQRGGECIYVATLLNDAVITKWPLVRLINIEVHVNGTPITALRGDGIIIATPTGSTAYTLSAGGPIIEPNAACMAVTPICAHELGAKPFVLSADRVVTITAGHEENRASLSADGGAPFEVLPDDIITITRSAHSTQLVRLKNTGFYELIYQKLSD